MRVHDRQGNLGHGRVPRLRRANQKVDFIEAMWQVVNWQDVSRRYQAAKASVPLISF